LQKDGLVGKYRLKNENLERSLRVANQTIYVIQQRLTDLESEHKRTLQTMDVQLKKLFETVNVLASKNIEKKDQVMYTQKS
jgi:hypothetical protein